MSKQEWWLAIMEKGDPIWLNYPDGYCAVKGDPNTEYPGEFLGLVPEGQDRAGQPVFLDPVEQRPYSGRGPMAALLKKEAEDRVPKCSMFMTPVPLHSKPWQEVQDGTWIDAESFADPVKLRAAFLEAWAWLKHCRENPPEPPPEPVPIEDRVDADALLEDRSY